jgi:hypothetical protein
MLIQPICACIALGAEDACRQHLREEQYERWKAMSNASTTVDEKPKQSAAMQEALASARQSFEMGSQRTSFDKAPLRSSLDISRSRRSSSEFPRSASRQTLVDEKRPQSRSGSLNQPRLSLEVAPVVTRPPALQRLSFDSATDRFLQLGVRPLLPVRRRSDYISGRRLSIVQQGIEREYPAHSTEFESKDPLQRSRSLR